MVDFARLNAERRARQRKPYIYDYLMNYLDHFSIDCETLSVRPNAAIISIGAQQFNPFNGEMGATHYVEVEFDSAARAGHVSGDTVAWWLTMDAAAMRLFRNDKKTKQPLSLALEGLANFMRPSGVIPKIWTMGPAEDATWLRNAYINGAVGMKEAWHYQNSYDVRTIVLAADLQDWPARSTPLHHALHDATYQAQVVTHCMMKLRKGLGMAPPKFMSETAKRPAATKTTKVDIGPAPVPEEEDDEL